MREGWYEAGSRSCAAGSKSVGSEISFACGVITALFTLNPSASRSSAGPFMSTEELWYSSGFVLNTIGFEGQSEGCKLPSSPFLLAEATIDVSQAIVASFSFPSCDIFMNSVPTRAPGHFLPLRWHWEHSGTFSSHFTLDLAVYLLKMEKRKGGFRPPQMAREYLAYLDLSLSTGLAASASWYMANHLDTTQALLMQEDG